ncbi:hypothetical protein [Natrinema sp. SYSU A 869]|uniref:hypothetical protein n=1 Tax=Natrinema sp. SYSU A 869 TaxID=2871694 RepID=UPI001CA3D2C6|nr:hypothetical protein [Natrinema sp. SYSU A 869]
MEELLEITDGILEEEDIPEEGEERYSYFSSVLRVMMEEGFETGMASLSGLLEMSLASLGGEILEHEDIERYEAVVDMINRFSDEQLELAFEYVLEFREMDQGIAATQNHVQLSEMADPVSEIQVDDSESAQKAVDLYSKCMDVCDNASTLLLALKRIDEGENLFDVDLTGMGYAAKLNELSDSKCETLVEGIDKDLRNAISHGDLVIEPYEEEVYDASTGKRYSFEGLEDKTKTCISVSNFMGSIVLIVTTKWVYSNDMN